MAAAVPRGVGPFLAFTDYTWDKCFEIDTPEEVIAFVKKVCAYKDMKTDRMATNIVSKFNLTNGVLTGLIFLTPTAQGTPPYPVLDPIMLPLGGVDLPHYTVFDLLGYCMARAALFDPIVDAGPKAPTAGNFYMPLLSLFCRWSKLLVSNNFLPNMHSITWVENAKEVPLKIVLGSTIPTDVGGKPAEQPGKTEVQEARLVKIIGAAATNGTNFKTKTPTEKDVDPEGKKRKIRKDDFAYPMKMNAAGKFEKQDFQLFGHCSESNQFVWYPFRLRGQTSETIYGLAMAPPKAPKTGAYTFGAFEGALEDPCINCQRMIRVLLGEQGQAASTPKPKAKVPTDDALLDDYYEQLGKDNVMAKKQKALDKSTSQNVLQYFGVTELKKNKGLPNKKGSIGISSFAAGGTNPRSLNALAVAPGGGDDDDNDDAEGGDEEAGEEEADEDDDAEDADEDDGEAGEDDEAGEEEGDGNAEEDDAGSEVAEEDNTAADEDEDADDAAGGDGEDEEADEDDGEEESGEDAEGGEEGGGMREEMRRRKQKKRTLRR
ncbi:hypothetical protein GLAREA_03982 [Glarea lozoyensis ATCC 20868]|uniref:Uncharacterized protein n=1 Tax=Glarea lozoyensis (strain ATCC 20868 / MF5171) TaxID=1116229 RepID=S3CZG4_GLAL2|nr:uncharacterized protein GLAREA_03982 [Glarea lozoyensis ATCC 20868]EPE31015.1 hypothetical protein GLAREA_03982 [Glarea lozoyensis ATCC 20868]